MLISKASEQSTSLISSLCLVQRGENNQDHIILITGCPLKRNLNCRVDAGTFPDPKDCRGFVKCAQSRAFPDKCNNGLFFDPVSDILHSSNVLTAIAQEICNCNTKAATNCQGRPTGGRGGECLYQQHLSSMGTAGSRGSRRGKELPGFGKGRG